MARLHGRIKEDGRMIYLAMGGIALVATIVTVCVIDVIRGEWGQ